METPDAGVKTEEPAAGVQMDGGDTSTPETDTRTVPVTVIQKMREELKGKDGKIQELETRLQSIPVSQPVQQAPAAAPAPPADPLEGLHDSDVITVKEAKKLVDTMQNSRGQYDSQTNAKLAHLEFAVNNPDYKDVIPRLKAKLDTDPSFAATALHDIRNSPNPMVTAYNYAKLIPAEPEKPPGPNPVSEIDEILANLEKPGSPAQVGGSGGISGGDKYAGLDDDEFFDFIQEVKRR